MRSGDEREEITTSDRVDKSKRFDSHKLKDYNRFVQNKEIKEDVEVREELGEFDWSITSVHIYTTDGMPIFSANISSELSEFNSNVVLQFYSTVKKFAEENLGTSLVDFKVGNERVFFRMDTTHGHIYLVTARLGDKARSGKKSAVYLHISSLISDISSLLFFYSEEGEIEEGFDMTEAISEMVSELASQKLVETSPVIIKDLSISYTMITDKTGIPILSRIYGEDTIFRDDPMLVTMFLHAINVFFNTNFADDLREINFGNSRLYIKNIREYFYAIVIEFAEEVELREDSLVHELSYELLDQMAELVGELGDEMINDISNDNLQLMVDSFIFKAIFRLTEELE